MFAGGPVLAQEESAAAENEAVEQTAGAEKSRQLDEIIVTAQKREQSLQDVPLSVAVVGAELLKETNVESLADIGRMVGNVKFENDNINNQVRIRGFGTTGNSGFDQSVGLFVDGAHLPRAIQYDLAFVDVRQVEVLRGPQGSVFGKNTIAGAISITSYDPNPDEWGADLSALIGQFDHKRFRGVLNAPITDQAALRLIAQHDRSEGYFVNSVKGERDEGRTTLALQGKALYEFDFGLRLVGKVTYYDYLIEGFGSQYSVIGPRATAIHAPFGGVEDDITDRRTQSNHTEEVHSVGYSANLKADYTLGKVDFTYLFSYSTIDTHSLLDGDGGPAPFNVIEFPEDFYVYGHELRMNMQFEELLGLGGNWNLMLGLFTDVSYLNTQSKITIEYNNMGAAALESLAEGTGFLAADLLAAGGEKLDNFFLQDQNSYALFGLLDWDATERLTLTLGGRVGLTKKEGTRIQDHNDTAVILRSQADEFTFSGSREDFSVTPKVSATYDFTEDFTTYVTIATGFKAGGFNSAGQDESTVQFDPENSISYESGIKSVWFDGALRVDVGLFWTDFTDLQQSQFASGDGSVITNGGEAVSRGVEWDMQWRPWPGGRLNISGGYLDSYFADFPNANCPPQESPLIVEEVLLGAEDSCDFTGRTTARAPKFSGGIVVSQIIPLGNLPFGLFINASATYESEQNLCVDLDALCAEPSSLLYGGAIGLSDRDRAWQLVVQGKNLTDETVRTGVFVPGPLSDSRMSLLQQPRRITAELRATF
ncbi:MAG: TonB-dependent receptor [Alphaproteobacteria bacterium]